MILIGLGSQVGNRLFHLVLAGFSEVIEEDEFAGLNPSEGPLFLLSSPECLPKWREMPWFKRVESFQVIEAPLRPDQILDMVRGMGADGR